MCRYVIAMVFLLPALSGNWWATASAWAAAPSRPNIVYIMADELGYYELSCMGNPQHQDAAASTGWRPRGSGSRQALAGLLGVRPDAVLPDDRQAQRPHVGAHRTAAARRCGRARRRSPRC